MTFRETLIAAVLPQAIEWVMQHPDEVLVAHGLVTEGDARQHAIARMTVRIVDAVIAEAQPSQATFAGVTIESQRCVVCHTTRHPEAILPCGCGSTTFEMIGRIDGQ